MQIEMEENRKEVKVVNIPTPCFWKSPGIKQYIALLDDKTFVKLMFICGGKDVTINHSTPELSAYEIREAYSKYNLISEDEFMTAYNKAYKSLSLTPELTPTS